MKMSSEHLLVPIEMVEYAIKEKKVRELQVFLIGKFLWSGKVELNKEQEIYLLTRVTSVSRGVIYSSIQRLELLGWVKRDNQNGWLFFRGFKRVKEDEGWIVRKAGVLFWEDLIQKQKFKAWLIGAFTSSFCLWRNRGVKTGLNLESPLPALHPVSLNILKKHLNISEKTAFNYRKLMVKYKYAEMFSHNQIVQDFTFNDLRSARIQGAKYLNLKLFGSGGTQRIETKKLKMVKGNVVVQKPNLIKPKIKIKNRR